MKAQQFGREFERQYSTHYHSQGIPLLISPAYLRQFGAGQIDLARLFEGEIEILELKLSPKISMSQRQRLRKAAELLGLIFGKTVVIKLVSPKAAHNDCQKGQEYLSYYL